MTDTDKRPLLYDPMPRKDIELPPRMPEADTIARLTAELAELRAAIFGGDNYATDLRHGNFVEMAQTLHAAQIEGAANG